MKLHKHTFSAITLSNINIFFVSSYGGCEVGGFMFLLRYTSQYRKTWTFTLTRASHMLHQYVFVNILYKCMFVNAYPFDFHFWIYPLKWKLPKSYIYFLWDSVYVYYCMLMESNGKSVLSFKDCEWPSVAQKPKYLVVQSVRFPDSSSVYRFNSSDVSKK